MRAALVHDWLVSYAGSEKVVEELMALWPTAPLYTLFHNPASMQNTPFEGKDIRVSGLNRLPGAARRYRSFLPLMPFAAEQFDLRDYDVVISSSHAVAKGILVSAEQLHLSYVHSPVRYAWDLYQQYLEEANLNAGARAMLAKLTLHYLRLWDSTTANRVDVFMANSQYVARRIWRTYRRPARVLYPPVQVGRFDPGRPRADFYLTLSRMVPYKKMDLIVEAFARSGKPLVVIGDGPDRARIESLATPNITVLGRQPDDVVADHLERCRAFVFAADEDFGITPVEAQAAGAPVIAYGKGGVLESVVSNQTGIFFGQQEVTSLNRAVDLFEAHPGFDTRVIRRQAERFASEHFATGAVEIVETAYAAFQRQEDPERAVLDLGSQGRP